MVFMVYEEIKRTDPTLSSMWSPAFIQKEHGRRGGGECKHLEVTRGMYKYELAFTASCVLASRTVCCGCLTQVRIDICWWYSFCHKMSFDQWDIFHQAVFSKNPPLPSELVSRHPPNSTNESSGQDLCLKGFLPRNRPGQVTSNRFGPVPCERYRIGGLMINPGPFV